MTFVYSVSVFRLCVDPIDLVRCTGADLQVDDSSCGDPMLYERGIMPIDLVRSIDSVCLISPFLSRRLPLSSWSPRPKSAA